MYPNFYNPYSSQSQMTMPTTNPISKIVDSLESVRSADIPMDGQAYYFPKADGSVIYSKRWLPNCTTQIMAYMPQNTQQTNTLSNDSSECLKTANLLDTDISERIKTIESKIDNIEKMISARNPGKKVTKDESNAID